MGIHVSSSGGHPAPAGAVMPQSTVERPGHQGLKVGYELFTLARSSHPHLSNGRCYHPGFLQGDDKGSRDLVNERAWSTAKATMEAVVIVLGLGGTHIQGRMERAFVLGGKWHQ